MGCGTIVIGFIVIIVLVAFVESYWYILLAIAAAWFIYRHLSAKNSLNTVHSINGFDNMDGCEFEKAIAQLLKGEGYSNIKLTPQTGDDGLDIIAYKNGIKVGFQCKCYSSNVGNSAVQQAYAGKTMYGCDRAIVVTNAYFTKSAIETAQRLNVELWDRNRLSSLSKSYRNSYDNNDYQSNTLFDIEWGWLFALGLVILLIGLVIRGAVTNYNSISVEKESSNQSINESEKPESSGSAETSLALQGVTLHETEVYASPDSTSYLNIDIEPGKVLEIVDEINGYYKVSYMSISGFVKSDNIKKINTHDTVSQSDYSLEGLEQKLSSIISAQESSTDVESYDPSVEEDVAIHVGSDETDDSSGSAESPHSKLEQDELLESSSEQEKVPSEITGKTTTKLKLRSTPDSKHGDGNVLAYLNENTEVLIQGVVGDFYLVEFNGMKGYVHSDYVIADDYEDSPVSTKTDYINESTSTASQLKKELARNDYSKVVDKFLRNYNDIANHPITTDMVVSERIVPETVARIDDMAIRVFGDYDLKIELQCMKGHEDGTIYIVFQDVITTLYKDATEEEIKDCYESVRERAENANYYASNVYFRDNVRITSTYKRVSMSYRDKRQYMEIIITYSSYK